MPATPCTTPCFRPSALLPALLAALGLCAFSAQPALAATTSASPSALLSTPTNDAATGMQLAQNTGLPPGARGKRAGPAEVAPVVIGNIRYGVLHFGKAEGLDQNGGYIVAQDKHSGERLWTLKVYDNHLDPQLEGDVQDVFITSLKRHGQALDVVDEKGRHYRVDVRKRSVKTK